MNKFIHRIDTDYNENVKDRMKKKKKKKEEKK